MSKYRTTLTWAAFLRSEADALLAMDFIETVTLSRTRQYVLAAILRRPEIHHTRDGATQQARNLAAELCDHVLVLTEVHARRLLATFERHYTRTKPDTSYHPTTINTQPQLTTYTHRVLRTGVLDGLIIEYRYTA
jgi:hypothetical protein